MKSLGIVFYASISIIIGVALVCIAVIFSFGNMQPYGVEYINSLLNYLQNSFYLRVTVFFSGLMLIIISSYFAQIILARFQKEKNIAFLTSSGEVTIALSAVEDIIRRITGILPEIKELRPDVIASKKGILVDLQVILKAEANIPELTSRLQDITKAKIQEVLGVDEQIIIKIHVTKIILAEDKKKKGTENIEPPIPFSGYGRV